ncbi:DB module domain-containing protein [Ditylenchus destructor]|nr:DB module domain-containing protein [Ditylenchus destructor]
MSKRAPDLRAVPYRARLLKAENILKLRIWLPLIAFALISQCLAVPHLPEVVYPSKANRQTRPYSLISTTPKPFVTLSTSIRPSNGTAKPRHSVSNSVNNFRVAQQKRLHAATHHEFSRHGGKTAVGSASSSAEARVVLAPIDDRRIYTIDKYYVSSERVDGEANPKDSKRVVFSSAENLDANQVLKEGKATLIELTTEEMQKRTTMHEPTSSTEVETTIATTLPTVAAGVTVAKAHAALQKEQKPKTIESRKRIHQNSGNIQIVSHDTATPNKQSQADPPSAEVRFPAERWQIPPALYSARAKSAEENQGNALLRPRSLNASTSQNQYEQQRKAYEDALNLYAKTQKQQNSPGQPQILPVPSIRSPTPSLSLPPAAVTNAKPLGRPNAAINNDGILPAKRAGLRATFATKRKEHQLPIPLPASPIDDSDLDLLMPAKPKQHLNLPLPDNTNLPPTYSGHQNTYPNNFIAQPVPIPINPTVNSAPYIARISPNEKLDLCCRKQNVSPVCQTMCNFDTFTDRSLVSAVLTNQCPGPQLGQAFDCASSKVDHSECCRRANIHLHNGGQCLPFCETHLPNISPNVLSYFACLPIFETIKSCYRDYQFNHPNIYGD